MEIYKAKQALRKDMAAKKSAFTGTELLDRSALILNRLEECLLFQSAERVALYHALPGEVQTAAFIERWYLRKQLFLPLVEGDNLRLLRYTGPESLRKGAFGIWEPKPDGEEAEEDEIELIIVPGVAFDAQCHRLGRGRGFYDRLLSSLQAPKVGICFDFQLVPFVPVEPFDRQMDYVVAERGIYSINEIGYR